MQIDVFLWGQPTSQFVILGLSQMHPYSNESNKGPHRNGIWHLISFIHVLHHLKMAQEHVNNSKKLIFIKVAL